MEWSNKDLPSLPGAHVEGSSKDLPSLPGAHVEGSYKDLPSLPGAPVEGSYKDLPSLPGAHVEGSSKDLPSLQGVYEEWVRLSKLGSSDVCAAMSSVGCPLTIEQIAAAQQESEEISSTIRYIESNHPVTADIFKKVREQLVVEGGILWRCVKLPVDGSVRPSVTVFPNGERGGLTRVRRGSSIELHGLATGHPLPFVTWRRASGKPLPPGRHLIANGKLTIMDTQVPEDVDEYLATATNTQGSDSTSRYCK